MSWAPFGPAREAPASASGSSLQRMVAAARRHGGAGALPKAPARRMVVVTCMDARIDPLRGLGLRLGDAHVVRNAGAEVSNDVGRSVGLSLELGTAEAMVIGHADCAAHGSDDAARDAARAGAAQLRNWFGDDLVAHALFYDVRTGRLEVLVDGRGA